ncbi:hypothetical protein ES319_D06G248500v1 [Gossypium barbadense]|uniref:Uncharacterized protein n=2 Tax=Gossypium TaxID=3633 RepID=A0A5J5RDL5_GOSBA|nr:hypothetical protein ES319_D06G248500v1 [Gossypium barbadense]PPD85449.1 hypothetical protein GOBAR_DD17606 [Gossypium barbadense]TYG66358.1 hypothetical protein ES288_D06G261500v1 [Gossypium darwinii]
MLDLTENPKLDLASSNEISTQKISVSNHISGFQYTADKPDSFVIDMDSFSHGGLNKEINQNPRITKSLSRKGSVRGDKKIITSNCTISNDKDSIVATSPKGSNTVEKPTTVSVGSTDQTNNPQVHHQITITTGNIKAPPDSRFSLLRRNNSRRSSSPWVFDPKRILFLFATLSSMGTILLIYFTLSIGKTVGDENAFD